MNVVNLFNHLLLDIQVIYNYFDTYNNATINSLTYAVVRTGAFIPIG